MIATAEVLNIDCYSDVLCVWAYGLQSRIDALHREFGQAIRIDHRFISIFGTTDDKVVKGWENEGGPAGYGAHVRGVAERLGGIDVHPEIWVHNRPATSLTPHLVLEAVKLLRDRGELAGICADDFNGRCLVEEAAWRMRVAFFRDLRDLGHMEVAEESIAGLSIPVAAVRALIANGHALAALSRDAEARHEQHIEGSPTFVLDGGREKLYGNIGTPVLLATVGALLAT